MTTDTPGQTDARTRLGEPEAIPFLAARIESELKASGLNTTLVSILPDGTWGPYVKLVSQRCGHRGFPVTFDYYLRYDEWANGCASIDKDQEGAIALVRRIVLAALDPDERRGEGE